MTVFPTMNCISLLSCLLLGPLHVKAASVNLQEDEDVWVWVGSPSPSPIVNKVEDWYFEQVVRKKQAAETIGPAPRNVLPSEYLARIFNLGEPGNTDDLNMKEVPGAGKLISTGDAGLLEANIASIQDTEMPGEPLQFLRQVKQQQTRLAQLQGDIIRSKDRYRFGEFWRRGFGYPEHCDNSGDCEKGYYCDKKQQCYPCTDQLGTTCGAHGDSMDACQSCDLYSQGMGLIDECQAPKPNAEKCFPKMEMDPYLAAAISAVIPVKEEAQKAFKDGKAEEAIKKYKEAIDELVDKLSKYKKVVPGSDMFVPPLRSPGASPSGSPNPRVLETTVEEYHALEDGAKKGKKKDKKGTKKMDKAESS